MQKQILRPKDVITEYSLSRTTIWRKEREGTFPKKVKLGSRAVGYLKSDLEAWLQSLKAPEPDSEPRP
ncbi:MAG: AlpA family phage regulatory protein [Desulfobaccales bacterium]